MQSQKSFKRFKRMYKPRFNQRKALRFRQFTRKRYALFACLGRVVTIGVLSVATLQSATAAHRHVSTDEVVSDTTRTAEKEATLEDPIIDKVGDLEEIEVMGSRAPLALGQAARMVTVLSREEIQAAPVQSINDLLKYAVGVDVRQRGPMGAQTDIGIRGSTQEQITILLNGINICDPQTGHNTFDLPCDLSDIVRIEVLEGPAGRIYGTSSLVGAINIVTRGGTEVRDDASTGEREYRGTRNVQARIEGGSFGYANLGIRYSRTSAPSHPRTLDNSLSASYTRSDGYQRSKAGALNSDYQGVKAFYQGSYTPSSFLVSPSSLKISWHAGWSTKGFGSNTFYSARYDEQYENTSKIFTAIQGEVNGWLHFRPDIYWNRSYDRFELIRGSEEKVPFNHHRTDVFGINLNSWFDWAAGRTAFGAELRNEDIVSTNLGEPLNNPYSHYKVGLNRSNLSFHLEHNVLLKRFTLSAGFIAAWSTCQKLNAKSQQLRIYPGIDGSLRLGDHWKVYASYNSSLRMPSFTELYYSVGGHKADKYLKPEELEAIEGGIKYDSRLWSLKASVFHHHARNMIDWVMDSHEPEPVWQSMNLTRLNTTGVELSLNYQLSIINGQLSYCYLNQQKDIPDHLQSQYALEYLRHKLTASLQLHLSSQLDLTLKYRYQERMGSYTDTEGNVCNYHPYSIIDGRLSWNADSYALYLEANNLLNHHYVDYGNVPQPGCWLKAGVMIKIKD